MSPAEMDAAAEEARKEFDELYANVGMSAQTLIVWYKKWFAKAGHKRLGRIIAGKIK